MVLMFSVLINGDVKCAVKMTGANLDYFDHPYVFRGSFNLRCYVQMADPI